MATNNSTPPDPNAKYKDKKIRFLDCKDHYELIFTDDFVQPTANGEDSNLTDVLIDMKAADKSKELVIFVCSNGGSCSALNMLLQHVLLFKHRFSVCSGSAYSCGFILFMACPIRFVSPFSSLLYHNMSSLAWGKADELHATAETMKKWQKEYIKAIGLDKILTKAELRLGETSEVWFTGQDLIDRGIAHPYEMFVERAKLTTVPNVYNINGVLYVEEEPGKYRKYYKDSKKETVSYDGMLDTWASQQIRSASHSS